MKEGRKSWVDLADLLVVLGLGMVFVGINREYGIECALIVCGSVIFFVGFLKVWVVISLERKKMSGSGTSRTTK